MTKTFLPTGLAPGRGRNVWSMKLALHEMVRRRWPSGKAFLVSQDVEHLGSYEATMTTELNKCKGVRSRN